MEDVLSDSSSSVDAVLDESDRPDDDEDVVPLSFEQPVIKRMVLKTSTAAAFFIIVPPSDCSVAQKSSAFHFTYLSFSRPADLFFMLIAAVMMFKSHNHL